MITVLLAAYQGRKYLREQMDSILNQTVNDLQVLISDDGSDDGTWEIIEEYVRRYPGQVRGVRHERSADSRLNPAAANFFWLLSQAEGERVLLSDQDDVWHVDKVERMLTAMTELEAVQGRECPVLLYSDASVVDRDLDIIAPSFFAYQKIDSTRTELARILVENPVTGGAVMMNGALLAYLKNAPESCVMHDWWIALTASCFGIIHGIREPLYLYRQHGHNTLGARETGSASDVRQRMKRGQEVKDNYRRMFEQASCFLEHYSGKLTQAQTETLQAFLSLPFQSPLGRLRTIRCYQFYKSSGLQTAAQCLTIPRNIHRRQE